MSDTTPHLFSTPLDALHRELGAKMVPFAGYSMPVQYPSGLMAEHHHTRSSAGLFDVSHMGQITLKGARAGLALESLIPMDVLGLEFNKQRYGLLINDAGGIIDDLMFTNRGYADGGQGDLFLIVNGACKNGDLAWIRERLSANFADVKVNYHPELALLALQGPQAVTALSRVLPGVERLVFMTGGSFRWQGDDLFITRSGYTGEDGFEISIHAGAADEFARLLLAQPEVKPIGLGARNSLRLEAGLCLYGNDIDTQTNPVEASLTWAIQKARRPGGEREAGYPGAHIIGALSPINPQTTAPKSIKKRVGLIAQERIPVRDGTPLIDQQGATIGVVTSGTLGPTVDVCIAIGFLPTALAVNGTVVNALVRGKAVAMTVSPMPFTPNRYFRGPAA